MLVVSLVAAMARNHVIGRDNTLPWLKFGVTTEKLMLVSVPGDLCSASVSPN